ncbi:PAQR family membrane homeostasis protein TrhA [Histidinibacterium lentulum]|uniref:Hemolysin III family protein n=1 Tax=Histidinibacterium lentulum TaxID=2480588 RepID=A0A3N2R522_9RHOB|nr:hemolysin III family protein [Histidinibacterium lentulum]ROU02493.1 hemolysin III family protein [Histidinibacterium lentulum]
MDNRNYENGYDSAYPVYSRPEKVADGVMHLVGTGFAITGAVLLIVLASGARPPGMVAAVSVYGAAMTLSFVISACYHMTPWERLRPGLRRLDHAAIFLKIAGTYTPLVALIGSTFAWAVLGIVWTLAAAGALIKLFIARAPGRLNTVLYLVLGWSSLALIWPLAQELPAGGTTLVFAGGLLYTAGTVFLHWENLRYQNAVWHGFVLAASACFFAAITWGVAVQAV